MILTFATTEPTKQGELPTTGGPRPGPIGSQPPRPVGIWKGARPAAIRIPSIQVDTEIELAEVIDGVMQDPSGPWIVAWYAETARLGIPGNVVLAGHVDYAGTGPAVFARLSDLKPDDNIEITGNDGQLYRFVVSWSRLYDAATAPVDEIVGATTNESLTLITCGGTFYQDTGEYDERLIVRATR